MKTYVVTPHENRLCETVLMMGLNISSRGVTWKIIPKLSLLPLLILSTVLVRNFDISLIGVHVGLHYLHA